MPHLFLLNGENGAPMRDADLVNAFLRHQVGAAAEIWGRCYPLVRRIIFRMVGPRQAGDCEDLIQEVFLRLFRQLPGLRDQDALRGFALAIAVRVVKGELRARRLKRWLNLFPEGTMPEQETRTVDLEGREAVGRFYGILDGLSPQHRAVFILRQVEGLELSEVAAAVGVSVATLKRWLPRILRRVFSQAKGDPLLAAYLATPSGGGAGNGLGAGARDGADDGTGT